MHLSTVIVLVFVAGLLLRANLLPDESRFYFGYPFLAYSPSILDGEVSEAYPEQVITEDGYSGFPMNVRVPYLGLSVIVWPCLLNLLFASGVLGCATLACGLVERRIRRE